MSDKSLFDICPDGEFFDRQREMDYLFARASQDKPAPGIFLCGARWMGKTEVLRRLHRGLFWSQARVAPVYYQFRQYGGAEAFCEDYLKQTVKQYLAFMTRSPMAVKAEVSLDRLERTLIDSDFSDMAELISRHRDAKKAGDSTAAFRNAIGAPQFISRRSGIPVYMIIDDLDAAREISLYGGPGILKEFMESLAAGPFSFIAASSDKKIIEGKAPGGQVEALSLDGMDAELSVTMMMELCRQHGMEFDTEILGVAAGRLQGNPMYMKNLIWAAHRDARPLVRLKDFADAYVNEVAGGNIGFALRSSLGINGLDELKVLNAAIGLGGAVTEDELAERLRIGRDEVKKIAEGLGKAGLLEANLGAVKWAGDAVAKDFLNYIYETRLKGRSAEEVKTSMARECLKEGFDLNGARVRGRFKEDVAGLLKSFNGQKVLRVLLRNPVFSSRFKNGAYKAAENRKEEDEVALPQVVGCFDSVRWEKNETGPQALIAQGFQNDRYDSGNEVVWIVGVKESLAPVNLGDVENFLRRTRILKENFRTTRVVKWLVGKEGFTLEAQKRVEGEGIYSSDSVQVRIIKESIEDRGAAARLRESDRIIPNKEFEIVLPMSTKAELVAARAVEEIGTEMGFDENAIGQIKAALVEACINAFEHSKIRQSKVFLRFVASGDRLTIHVQNGGVDFDSPSAGAAPAATTLPHKRGWGIELMKGLMDEVRFETLRGGAKIVLVKYLIKKGDGEDDKEA